MIEKYLRNGTINRVAIAMDVKMRRLLPDNIRALCAEKSIQAEFIGTDYSEKTPQKCWNQKYLDLLCWVSIAESFNLDYLLYLREVADYVAKAKRKKIIISGITIVLVIVAGVLISCYVQRGRV